MVAKGLVSEEELNARMALLAEAEEAPSRFAPGDTVLVRNIDPEGHTHVPHYVRGKRGVVQRDRGIFVFPEAHDHGESPRLQHVYSVRFAARDIWGQGASDRDSLHFSLWDEYMEPA